MKLRVNGIIQESITDGPGFRYVIFTQGCPHRCPGCHNPQTHDPLQGYDVEIEDLLGDINSNPLLQGVTFSGGEPFMQAAALAALARKVHEIGKDVVTFTGFVYEELLETAATDPSGVCALLKETDLLIDGRFLIEERDLTLQYRGSRNQRIWHLQPNSVEPVPAASSDP
jgi:anaerobic ribonucleoside-triphosphate reductase activating protein